MDGSPGQRAQEVAAGHGLHLLRRIGSGGMGDVFLAKRRGAAGFEKLVVVKRLAERLVDVDGVGQTLIKEANIMVRLSHPNIVAVLDLVFDRGEYLMVLELVDGCSFRRVVSYASKNGLELPIEFCLAVTVRILRALEYAHTLVDETGKSIPVVHCDISPENVLLSRHGEVKLTDFGIAHVLHTTSMTGEGRIRGKFRYIAPEQLEGKRVGPSTDVFSVGLLLYELFTLRAARRGENTVSLVSEALRSGPIGLPSDVHHRAPELKNMPELDAIVAKATDPSPDARYQSAGAMADAIEELGLDHRMNLSPDKAIVPFARSLFEREDFSPPLSTRPDEDLAEQPVRTGGVTGTGMGTGSATGSGATLSLRAKPMVLVVDDSEIVREVLSRSLPRFGLRVATVDSGEGALDWLSSNECDIVLADLNMPDLSGLELCSFLRSNPSLADLPVILLTSETDSSRVVTGLGVGADDYIRKGVSEAEIAARIHAILRRSLVRGQ